MPFGLMGDMGHIMLLFVLCSGHCILGVDCMDPSLSVTPSLCWIVIHLYFWGSVVLWKMKNAELAGSS